MGLNHYIRFQNLQDKTVEKCYDLKRSRIFELHAFCMQNSKIEIYCLHGNHLQYAKIEVI